MLYQIRRVNKDLFAPEISNYTNGEWKGIDKRDVSNLLSREDKAYHFCYCTCYEDAYETITYFMMRKYSYPSKEYFEYEKRR